MRLVLEAAPGCTRSGWRSVPSHVEAACSRSRRGHPETSHTQKKEEKKKSDHQVYSLNERKIQVTIQLYNTFINIKTQKIIQYIVGGRHISRYTAYSLWRRS